MLSKSPLVLKTVVQPVFHLNRANTSNSYLNTEDVFYTAAIISVVKQYNTATTGKTANS